VAVVVPTKVPPTETAAETTVELSDVTRFPPESVISTDGWVVNAAPEAAPAALVSTAIAEAEPADVKVKVSVVAPPKTPGAFNDNRYWLPTAPLKATSENLVLPEVRPEERVPAS
jgi:hypothetical protein